MHTDTMVNPRACVRVCVCRGSRGWGGFGRQAAGDGWLVCVSCRQTADRPARGILQGVWNSHSLSVWPAAKRKRLCVCAQVLEPCARTHTQRRRERRREVVLLPLPLASNLWDILQPVPTLRLYNATTVESTNEEGERESGGGGGGGEIKN